MSPRCSIMRQRCPVGRVHLWMIAAALLLPSCEEGRNFTLFGYTTAPQYDPRIHSVYVPIFKNRTMWKGMEFDLTRAVVREIEAKTPYKVVSNCEAADTELIGTIINFNKNILNRNQLNEVREAETTLAVEVIWRNRAPVKSCRSRDRQEPSRPRSPRYRRPRRLRAACQYPTFRQTCLRRLLPRRTRRLRPRRRNRRCWCNRSAGLFPSWDSQSPRLSRKTWIAWLFRSYR